VISAIQITNALAAEMVSVKGKTENCLLRREMAEATKEKWLQWVALTTTILAVCAAISSLKASSYSTRVQIQTTKEANNWAYYQSKSIKEHSFNLNRDILSAIRLSEANNPRLQKYLSARIKEYSDAIGRYDKEKEQIKGEADKINQEQEILKLHNANFALAVMILQIAIMLSAIGALIKKKIMWYTGMVFGVLGCLYMINGFLLWL
jgi:hypothetical protein